MTSISHSLVGAEQHLPWNKGRLIGPKPPLKLPEIWAIRIRLQLANRPRDLALFNLAIDSKLRSCDLVKLRVQDVAQGGKAALPVHRHAAEDLTAGEVRADRADPRIRRGVDRRGRPRPRTVPVPQSSH